MPGMQGPSTLSEDQEDRLASGAAAVLTALGRVNEPSITRTVLTFEALWLRRQTWLGPVYWGSRAPTLHASIIAVARRYNDLLTPEPGLQPPTPDYAVAVLASELTDPQDRSVLRMLVSALGLLPIGTVVQLATGEVAEVVKGARGLGEKPVVRLLADPKNQPYAEAVDVDLAQDPQRSVLRVLSVDGWRKGLDQQPRSDIGEAYDPDAHDSRAPLPSASAAMPPPPVAHAPPLAPMLSPQNHVPPPRAASGSYAQHEWGGETDPKNDRQRDSSSSFQSVEHHSSQSLASMGSSPSAVAEAMGRMINDALTPPSIAPKDGDRTVFQPGGPEELAERRSNRAKAIREPTARGNLAATPLPHVLVYMLDHALTGSVVFGGEASGDTIYFVRGVPAKVKLGEEVALLGDVLVDAGALDKVAVDQAAEAAQRIETLLGEYLVGHDLVSREMLDWALESQLVQKIAHLANLAPEIEYVYYRDSDLLEGWGADAKLSHPLNPILGSVRNWNDRARVRATLNRVSKHPLVIHPNADLGTLATMAEEQALIDAIRAGRMAPPEVFKRNFADEEIVSSLLYTLAVTRQFAFKGQQKGPMGAPASAASSAVSSAIGTPSTSRASGARPVERAPEPRRPIAGSAAMAAPLKIRRTGERAQVSSEPARSNAPQATGESTSKKGTMMGLQPAAPLAQRTPPPPPNEDEDEDDDAKTIARMPGTTSFLAQRTPARLASAPTGAPAIDLSDDGLADAEAALEAMQSFRLAEAALQRNDVSNAEMLAKKAVEGDPAQADYVTLLAWIRALREPAAVAEAVGTMSKVLLDDPSHERALLYRGRLLVRANRLRDALNDFSELVSTNPQNREAASELRLLKDKIAAGER
jgi:tetratricopeptide (TPR) repeat protein